MIRGHLNLMTCGHLIPFLTIGVTIKLLRGPLQVGEVQTKESGAYSFAGLPPAGYHVVEVQPAWLRLSTTPDEVAVDLAAGENRTVDFGDWNGWPIWLPLIVR